MKVIKPQVFDPSTTVISTTAPEPTPDWVSGSTYAKDDVVLHPWTDGNGVTVKYKWTSLVSTNTAEPGTDDTKWLRGTVCNRCAMFDEQVSTASTATDSLTVVINAPFANSVALIGLVGSSVTITLTDNGASPPVYQEVISLDGTLISDWYMYFFEPYAFATEVVLTDLPPYGQAQLSVALTGAGTVAIGEMIWGTFYTLGEFGTEQGATLGIIDYSRKDTDPDTGVTTFTRRAFSKRMNAQFMLQNSQIKTVLNILADLRAVPSVYIGSDDPDYTSLIVYGFYRDFSIDIAYPTRSLCSLEVEGLV